MHTNGTFLLDLYKIGARHLFIYFGQYICSDGFAI